MTETVKDMSAELLSTSSSNTVGSSLQPSAQDVVVRSSTETEKQYYENLALKAVVEALVYHIISSDNIVYAMDRAAKTCTKMGVPPEVADELILSIIRNHKKTTNKNPLSILF